RGGRVSRAGARGPGPSPGESCRPRAGRRPAIRLPQRAPAPGRAAADRRYPARGRAHRAGPAGSPPAGLAGGVSGHLCLADAIARGDEAVRIAEAAEHPFSIAASSYQVARLYLLKGDFNRAVVLYERVLPYLSEHMIGGGTPAVRYDLAHALARLGRMTPVPG